MKNYKNVLSHWIDISMEKIRLRISFFNEFDILTALNLNIE